MRMLVRTLLVFASATTTLTTRSTVLLLLPLRVLLLLMLLLLLLSTLLLLRSISWLARRSRAPLAGRLLARSCARRVIGRVAWFHVDVSGGWCPGVDWVWAWAMMFRARARGVFQE